WCVPASSCAAGYPAPPTTASARHACCTPPAAPPLVALQVRPTPRSAAHNDDQPARRSEATRMASFDYDLAIIGAGSGGLTAARLGRFFAKRVALIDKDHLGGDCLNYGCVPSKALIKASRVAHEAITDIGKLDSAEVLSELGPDVLLGGATFRDPHTLRVGDRDITAKYILIASGSRPAVPDIDGLAEAGYLTNEDVFDLSKLPSRLAVSGGGPIGVELAQALHRLGSAVTIVQRGAHLIPRDDGDMIDILERQFVDEGIDVRINTPPTAVRRTGGDLLLTLGADPLRV